MFSLSGMPVDGLAVIEDLLGLGPRVEACMPPTVSTPRPGPCPGSKRGASKAAKKAAKSVKAPKKTAKTLTPLTDTVAKKTAVGKAPSAPNNGGGAPEADEAPPVKEITAKDLFGPQGQRNPTRVPPEVLASLKEAYETDYAGLSSRVKSAGADENQVIVNGEVFGPDGKNVGLFTRIVMRGESGEVAAKHEMLFLDSEFQGQGFAREFNNKAMAWYRDKDFSEVRLLANADVGAYAWARAGYDWVAPEDAGKLVNRLREMAAGKDKSAARLARGMLKRFTGAEFGTPGYPTPFEVSELGRPEGAGKGDMWPGKFLFRSAKSRQSPESLGWNAVLRLQPLGQPVTAAATVAATAERAAMMGKIAEIHDGWVGDNLSSTDFVPRKGSPDFNLYYVDVDGSGAAQDDLSAAMSRVFRSAAGAGV